MKVTFTDIAWRNNDDSEIFNLHALKSITLEGMESGIITIECANGVFKAPYCKLQFGGGVSHYEVVTNHPYDVDWFLNIAIFEHKVCVVDAVQSAVEEWFRKKCKRFCC